MDENLAEICEVQHAPGVYNSYITLHIFCFIMAAK